MKVKEKPLCIAVSGGSSSGKKQVCDMIIHQLASVSNLTLDKVIVIHMEQFYKTLKGQELELAHKNQYNFDHPDAIDFELLQDVMRQFSKGSLPIYIPQYDFEHHQRLEKFIEIQQIPEVILFAGIHMLYSKCIRDEMDLKLFVDVDCDSRLARQVMRDSSVRYHKNIDSIIESYLMHVKPAFEEFILPTKKYADVILPKGPENQVAIDLLTQHILETLRHGKSAKLFEAALPQKRNLYSKTLKNQFQPILD